MRKAILIAMLAFLACCAQPVKEDVPASKPLVVTHGRSRQERQSDAWRNLENEELVLVIEKTDVTKWAVSDGVILSDRYRSDLWLEACQLCHFSRVSIFEDGVLFLDGEERQVSIGHRQRLAAFWSKVVNR